MAAQNSSSLISSIYKSRKVVLELMENQGYSIDDYSNFSINEVNSMTINNQLDMLLEKKDNDSTSERKQRIYIKYHLGKSIRPNNLQEMIDDLFNLEETLRKEDTLYIIIKEDVNETLMNELKLIWERDQILIVIESLKQLQFNITQHSFVPQHIVMSESEVNEIMNYYNIVDKSQFPDISRFDPVARAICLRPGQVCRIIRPSKTAISTNYYRICI